MGTNRFIKDIVKAAPGYAGDLQRLTDRVLGEMAGVRDAQGYICNDNLSLGIMGDGTEPDYPDRFWGHCSSCSQDEVASSEDSGNPLVPSKTEE